MSSSKKLSLLGTNPNLKRDRSSFLSTQDTRYPSTNYTTQQGSRFSLQTPAISPLHIDKAPATRYSDNLSTIQQRLSSKKKKQPVLPTSTHSSTRDRLSSYLSYDDQQSRCRARIKQDSSYYHLSQNIFTFAEKAIPQDVIDEFNRVRTLSLDPAKIIVCRGYLAEISHLYYTIDNVVFFVNIGPCFRLRDTAEPVRVEVGKGVIKIVECRLRRSMIKSKNQRVLVMVHSEALSFYMASTDQIGKLYIEDLHLELNLPGEIVTELAFSDAGDLFYVDRDGDLNIISDKPSKKLFLFKTGYQELYTKNRQPSTVCQFIRKYRDEGFNESLKYISKSFSERWNRFLSSRIICRSIHVDNHRKLIIALIVKVYSNGQQDGTIAVYRLHEDSKASMIQVINQVQLYKILSGFGLLLNPQCFNLFRLYSVEQSYFPDSNIQIVLTNGTRIYAQVTRDFVKPLKTIYPPNIAQGHLRGNKINSKSPIIVKSQRIEMTLNNQIELMDCSLKKQLFLQFYQLSSRILTYLSSRSNAYQRPIVGQVGWHTFGNPGTSYPQQISSFPVLQSTFFPQKIGQLLCGSIQTRYQMTCPQLHELARQVYLPPDFIVMMSEREMELMGRLRPIDVAVLWLTKLSLEDCQVKFEEGIKIWKRVEVVSMLLMVLADKQGVYYTTTELLRGLEAEVSRRRSRVDSFDLNLKNEPKIVSTQQLDKSVFQKANILFNQLGEISEPIKEEEDPLDVYSVLIKNQVKILPCNTKQQALCLYISRILRPVWWRQAKSLSEDETKIISDKLGYIYEFISNNPINSLDSLITKAKQGPRPVSLQDQLQSFTMRCIQILSFLRTVYWIPDGQFQQLVAQDNSFFQSYLFNELYKHDNSVISYWSVEFSKLVDEKFFKVARLYFRVKDVRNQKAVISMCEDFGELPAYFLDDLRKNRNINVESLRRHIGGKETNQDILRQGSLEQKYEAALELSLTSHYIQEKIRYTDMAIEFAKKFLEDRSISRQVRYAYQTDLNNLSRKKKLFFIQKALIDAMMSRGSSNSASIINLLHNNQFDPNNLKESVLKSADDTVILIWYLNFPPANTSEYNISIELDKFITNHQTNWPKELEDNLRYVFGLIDQSTKQSFLPTFVTKIETFSLQQYQREFENIISSPVINFKKRSPYWFSQLLLAEGFTISDLIKVYSSKVSEALLRIQTEDYSQLLMTTFYYWIFALHQLASFVGLKDIQAMVKPIFQEHVVRLLQVDRISSDKAAQLRVILSKFKDFYD